ncbi:hypothetical protein AKJ16_DCAP10060 [Drosera capensis]
MKSSSHKYCVTALVAGAAKEATTRTEATGAVTAKAGDGRLPGKSKARSGKVRLCQGLLAKKGAAAFERKKEGGEKRKEN